MELRRDLVDIKGIMQRLGGGWQQPMPLGDDAWFVLGPGLKKIMVSYDPDSEPGVEWIHASVSYDTRDQPIRRYPSYSDLKELHRAVWGDGHAYQVFVPPDEHINLNQNVLHLWGHLDGSPALPNFGWKGTI